jgi:ABC-type uncharacterized transport system fused permease/ATPase subunit
MMIKIQYNLVFEVNERALRTDYKYYDDPEFYTQFSYAQQNYPGQANNVISMVPQLLRSLVTALAMGAVISSAGSALLFITLAFVIAQTVIQLPLIKKQADLSLNLTDSSRRTSYVYRNLQIKENTAELRTSRAGEKLLESYRNAIRGMMDIYKRFIRLTLKYSVIQGALSPLQTSLIRCT